MPLATGTLTVFQGNFNFTGVFQVTKENITITGTFQPQISSSQAVNSPDATFTCDNVRTCSGKQNILTDKGQSIVGPLSVNFVLQPRASGEKNMVLTCPCNLTSGDVINSGSANVNVQ